jgi:hypothetical protein
MGIVGSNVSAYEIEKVFREQAMGKRAGSPGSRQAGSDIFAEFVCRTVMMCRSKGMCFLWEGGYPLM